MSKFKINQVVYDGENKEFVKITNGISLGLDSLSDPNRELIEPTEAMAIRFIGFRADSKPDLAFTYRKVNVKNLTPVTEDKADFFKTLFETEKPKHYKFWGRI